VETYIVIPEGLSIDKEGRFYASDYYMATLDLVCRLCKEEDRVYLAPANTFGAHQPEDHFGSYYLRQHGCRADIGMIGDDIQRKGYLDTLDNAVYLKGYLQRIHQWPPGEVILVCNRPHAWRGYLVFRFCGYKIKKVAGSRPSVRSGRKMVRRLWFYDVPVIQYFYEIFAIVYNSMRFLIKKNNT
jgi:hypothetical protein